MNQPCTCSFSAFEAVPELQKQTQIDFESILRVSARVFDQWAEIIGCERCRTDFTTLIIITTAAERLLTLYTAICKAYGLSEKQLDPTDKGLDTHPHESTSSAKGSTATTQTDTASPVCAHSMMKFGKLSLEGDDASLLAHVLLSRSLVRLGELLENYTCLAFGDNNTNNKDNTLVACESSLVETMERLILLVAQVKI
ncbi:hypothetical protein COCC4DRAFT_151705 [Bipolaris maydis ATCC 48331]|uniref:Uncharacterized protein n=2 Tax=Cochliobolus heterostrophus TaxID=5016 RepID=M2UC51_COCH5|nr:uncharacterized protein COCC4DRAFT_151705 [Bipolaris maydis ATCC 48331]EMD85573.1 hypothetical protein COCHEDRAFT_1035467 [Bipolaris maydis C5]ENH99974.1 hypothetical protein COCC4DRAFT_151705 [Bipolaris maydis ATCC 48331]KAJ6204158.1 hypothetical protein PSV09DRAFT_1035467 [Bipolaris maydis]